MRLLRLELNRRRDEETTHVFPNSAMDQDDEESSGFDWRTGEKAGIEHPRFLGYGGSGEVHEVASLLKFGLLADVCDIRKAGTPGVVPTNA